jgi:manganese/zinc/iron transport system permease protein
MDYLFLDPLIRGPFWASLFLSLLLSLVGVVVFFSKKPLLGEVIAHCSYPGAILGLILSIITLKQENPVFILIIAFGLALVGSLILKRIQAFQTADSSMTLVLSGFFGLGVFMSSIIQQKFPKFYRLAQGYLFGQVSTMTDIHIILYASVLVLVGLIFYLNFSKIKLILFDPMQAHFLGGGKIAILLEVLICASLVLGIRGVGVVLVSSFFVAPAIFTLRFCKTLKSSIIVALSMASILNVVAFSFPLKAPIGPLMVLLLSSVAFLTLRKKPHVTTS